jgi:hypothetical protein
MAAKIGGSGAELWAIKAATSSRLADRTRKTGRYGLMLTLR